MRVGSLPVAVVVTLTSSAEALADRWDPFGAPGDHNGFAPMSTTTTTSGSKVDESEARPRRWYGSQTLAVDATSIGLVIAGARMHSSEWSTLGFFGYALGGPVVHGFHGHGEKALGSGVMRLGLPFGFGFAGYAATDDGESMFSGLYGFVIGSLIGVGTAITLDASVLAWEPRPIEAWQPRVSFGRDRALVGATGSF